MQGVIGEPPLKATICFKSASKFPGIITIRRVMSIEVTH